MGQIRYLKDKISSRNPVENRSTPNGQFSDEIRPTLNNIDSGVHVDEDMNEGGEKYKVVRQRTKSAEHTLDQDPILEEMLKQNSYKDT